MLREVPYGRPLSLSELSGYSVSPFLAAKYARSGWLERIGTGMYVLAGQRLGRDQGLLVLAREWPNLHVASRSALAWQGVEHELEVRPSLWLAGDRRGPLPGWFTTVFPGEYRSWRLFSPSVGQQGLFTPPGVTEGVMVATKERAVIELFRDVGVKVDPDQARNAFEMTAGLRTEMLGGLLQRCTSVKAVRLVLWWGHEMGNVDVATLKRKFDLPTGSRSRWVGALPDGSTLIIPPC